MEQAKILHIEDSVVIRECIEHVLAVNGIHKVVAYAESVAQAQERLGEIKAKKLDANVILLDANLQGGAFQNHPRVIVDTMKDMGLRIPVIGFSGNGLAERGLKLGKDMVVDLIKNNNGDTQKLEVVLNALPEPAEYKEQSEN